MIRKNNKNLLFLYVPSSLNYSIIRQTNNKLNNEKKFVCIYIYNKHYYTYLYYTFSYFKLNKTADCLTFQFTKYYSWKNFFEFFLKKFLKSLTTYFIKKIKFKGKIYKVQKVKRSRRGQRYAFRFGHYFLMCVRFKNMKIKQKKKLKLFFRFTAYKKYMWILRTIVSWRKWNMYTKRGMRLNKTVLKKKPGKKSTYF